MAQPKISMTGEVTQIIGPISGACVIHTTSDIRGGKSLDVSGYTPADSVIAEGHLVIVETATGIYKPLNIASGAYVELPSGHTYAGVLTADILKSRPIAAITVGGTVNDALAPYPISDAIKTILKHIAFIKD